MSTARLLMLMPLVALSLAAAEFRDLGVVDAHAHVFVNTPALSSMLDRLNMRFVNITVLDPYERGYETLEPQHKGALEVFAGTGGRAPWIASFDASGYRQAGFAQWVIAELENSFREGAVGVKIYKTIGMYLHDDKGVYVMPDDPVFASILDAIAAHGKTLYAHIAEPVAAWRPFDASDPDSGYYRENPGWLMFSKPGMPAKSTILSARDRMIGQHPKLRIVGCHLGSSEDNVDEVAWRLDRYPNYVVDTAARVTHLALQPRDKVRAFLIKYQDRVLYATDQGVLAYQDPAARVRSWETTLMRDWKFFATDEEVEYMHRPVRGLALPEDVLRKLFRTNAEKWVPGIAAH